MQRKAEKSPEWHKKKKVGKLNSGMAIICCCPSILGLHYSKVNFQFIGYNSSTIDEK
jgi:hypothetical protein